MGTYRQKPSIAQRGSVSASILGIVVFLAGVGLLAFTFRLAYDMFSAPTEHALGADGKATLDLAKAGQSLIGILTRILMLIVMGLIGSLIANRGISLFAGSRTSSRPADATPREKREARDAKEPLSPQPGPSQK